MKKIFVPVIALSLFAFGAVAFAMNDVPIVGGGVLPYVTSATNYSEEDLVALIAKLQKQLELVRQNNVQCSLAEVDLSLGDGEDAVSKVHTKNLQAFLKEKGFFKLEPTGYFGKITQAALTSFQKANGLEQTGSLNASVRSYVATLKCKKGFVQNIKTENKVEYKNEAKDTSISVSTVSSISLSGEGNTVRWSTVGTAKGGFKIVWSKNPNPTYPNRDGDKYIYLTDPNANTTTLEAFNGSGTYHTRVCEYLDGVCGRYSNEISISL
jgi:peptidoglycan hydrolase-like protein with peptidoglycan-binding domain